MDGEAAANFLNYSSDIIIIKVYGELETQSTSGTREHSSRYHEKKGFGFALVTSVIIIFAACMELVSLFGTSTVQRALR